MKKLVSLLVALLLVAICGAVPAFAADDKVTAGGAAVSFDVQPAVVDGVLMVPVRAVAESLGGKVSWDNGKVLITTDKHTVQFTIGSAVARIDGHDVDLKTPVILKESRTLVPASFLVTFYGQTLMISDPSLKDPAAMAYLDKLATATPKNADINMTENIVMSMAGSVPAGVPDSMAMTITMAGQVRGDEMLLNVATAMPTMGISVQAVSAARGGKAYTGVGGKWQTVDISQVQAQAAQAIAGLAGPAAMVREAHLGAKRTVDGKTLQDVSFTFDPAVMSALTNQMLQQFVGTMPAGTKFDMSWDQMIETYTFDANGMVVGMGLDAGLTATVEEAGQTLSFHVTIQANGTYTPNETPITWPADLPK